MLDVNPETVCGIINLARQFQADAELGYPDADPDLGDEDLEDLLASHEEDPVYAEMRETIRDLEPDQQVCLVALMWLGRGDFSLDEWPQALSEAGERWTPHTAEYLATTPLVADYLMEGLDQHGLSCE